MRPKISAKLLNVFLVLFLIGGMLFCIRPQAYQQNYPNVVSTKTIPNESQPDTGAKNAELINGLWTIDISSECIEDECSNLKASIPVTTRDFIQLKNLQLRGLSELPYDKSLWIVISFITDHPSYAGLPIKVCLSNTSIKRDKDKSITLLNSDMTMGVDLDHLKIVNGNEDCTSEQSIKTFVKNGNWQEYSFLDLERFFVTGEHAQKLHFELQGHFYEVDSQRKLGSQFQLEVEIK